MYAIIEVADKQFKVSKDDTIYVPLLDQEVDASITIEEVLLVSNDGDIQVGTPTIDGASVSATVLEHVKADKVLVFKKKRRKRFKVKRGHRQQYTRLQINELSLGGKKKKSASKSKKDEAPVEAAESES
jgi:large subunit ribosomal protein L21